MILVGIDDTDRLDTPGTNQIARAVVKDVGGVARCRLILRQQLSSDPRVRMTRHNSAATLLFEGVAPDDPDFRAALVASLRSRSAEGSDPGLCIASSVPSAVTAFGQTCRERFVTQDEARTLAAAHDLFLLGLGGDEGGVIGALAAVGLGATGDHGRVVQVGGVADDLRGIAPTEAVRRRGVERIIDAHSGADATPQSIDVGKHLRPSVRGHRVTLFVEPTGGADGTYSAVRRD